MRPHPQRVTRKKDHVKLVILILFLAIFAAVLLTNNLAVQTTHAFSSGPLPGHTGAPSEQTCSVCHGGPAGGGQFTIVAPANYQPGQTYQITVRHTTNDASRMRWGFQLTGLTAGSTRAGSMQSIDSFTNVTEADVAGGIRQYIQHNSGGTFAGQSNGANWTFNWTAPSSNVGPVTFYAAGNQANNNGVNSGDQIYTTSVIAQPATTPTPSTIQFSAANYSVAEGGVSATVTVTRSGDTAAAASVFYSSTDSPEFIGCDVVRGEALPRCDYITTLDVLVFAAGETQKTVQIPIIDDGYVEGAETLTLTLQNAAGASLGTQSTAILTITDNDVVDTTNPVGSSPFFVRQQYLDFLSREPEPTGLAAWLDVLNRCNGGFAGSDPSCDRIEVSASFFRSSEFQGKGYFFYRFYTTSFGPRPTFAVFDRDMKLFSARTDAEVEPKKEAFIADFVARAAWKTKYDSLANAVYVDTLLQTAGVQLASRDQLVSELISGARTRAQVLRAIVESDEVNGREFNRAFVAMQYFGYLRRDPEEDGYQAWLRVINANPADYRQMVDGFVNSVEYRKRFGQP